MSFKILGIVGLSICFVVLVGTRVTQKTRLNTLESSIIGLNQTQLAEILQAISDTNDTLLLNDMGIDMLLLQQSQFNDSFTTHVDQEENEVAGVQQTIYNLFAIFNGEKWQSELDVQPYSDFSNPTPISCGSPYGHLTFVSSVFNITSNDNVVFTRITRAANRLSDVFGGAETVDMPGIFLPNGTWMGTMEYDEDLVEDSANTQLRVVKFQLDDFNIEEGFDLFNEASNTTAFCSNTINVPVLLSNIYNARVCGIVSNTFVIDPPGAHLHLMTEAARKTQIYAFKLLFMQV